MNNSIESRINLKFLETSKTVFVADNEDTINLYVYTVCQMKELCRYTEALEYFIIALPWRIKNYGDKAQKTRNVYRFISECYAWLGEEAKAAEYNALVGD